MIEQNYELALEKYMIQKFVEENQRAPNPIELRLLKRAGDKQFPRINQVGFSGHLMTKPQYASESSAEDENLNRKALYEDIMLADSRIEKMVVDLENIFRSLYATGRSIKRRLDTIENRVDNVLLLSGTTDAFVYGVEENFIIQDLIDFDNTTASVEGGFVTLGRDGFGLVNLSDAGIAYSTVADRGYIGFQNTSAIESLKEDDGTFWEHLVYTSYATGRVSVIIDITLDSPQFVSEFRFSGALSGINSRTSATVFYSPDGKSFKAVEPAEYVITTGETLFDIGQDNVKTIRLMLSKSRYDTTANIKNQYVYIFSLDSIKIYSNGYVGDGQSVLYAGPYQILDADGTEVSFTKATCDVCMSAGEDSAVSTYLSVDGIDYKPIDTSGTGLAVLTFENGADDGTEVLLDDSFNEFVALDTAFVELDTNDVLLNKSVSADYKASFIQKSVMVKRNIPYVIESERPKVYGGISGWDYLVDKKMYRTTVSVVNPAGIGIDLGSTSAFLNGVAVTGKILLPVGISVFETSEANWLALPNGLTTIQALRAADTLYPYNHKHLIEGYVYSDLFIGERLYPGVDEYFGSLLTYVSPEVFATKELENDLSIYTIEDTDGLVFKVKTKKTDSTWSNEYFDVSWMVSRGGYDRLWLKLVLNSSTQYVSPIVTSVRMRVI